MFWFGKFDYFPGNRSSPVLIDGGRICHQVDRDDERNVCQAGQQSDLQNLFAPAGFFEYLQYGVGGKFQLPSAPLWSGGGVDSICSFPMLGHSYGKGQLPPGVMLQGMFRSNFVLFGIPISTALFGDQAAGIAAILIAVIIPLYNVLAVVSLELFNGKKPSVTKILIWIVTNPLIIGSVVGILFLVFHITLPTVLYDTITDLSSIATPWLLWFWVLRSALGMCAITSKSYS